MSNHEHQHPAVLAPADAPAESVVNVQVAEASKGNIETWMETRVRVRIGEDVNTMTESKYVNEVAKAEAAVTKIKTNAVEAGVDLDDDTVLAAIAKVPVPVAELSQSFTRHNALTKAGCSLLVPDERRFVDVFMRSYKLEENDAIKEKVEDPTFESIPGTYNVYDDILAPKATRGATPLSKVSKILVNMTPEQQAELLSQLAALVQR